MSIHVAKPEHEVVYQDLCKLIARHAEKMTPLEVLAVAANMVGKLVAMQDQRKTSVAMAMEVVSRNIEVGNKAVIDQLVNSNGGTA